MIAQALGPPYEHELRIRLQSVKESWDMCLAWKVIRAIERAYGMVQVQILDRDHLLLALGSPEASASRLADSGHHRTWLAIYCMSSARILSLQDTLSRSLLQVGLPLAHCSGFTSWDVGCA